jgi:hypothetical protein
MTCDHHDLGSIAVQGIAGDATFLSFPNKWRFKRGRSGEKRTIKREEDDQGRIF